MLWLAFTCAVGLGPCNGEPPNQTPCFAERAAQRNCVCRARGLNDNCLLATKSVGKCEQALKRLACIGDRNQTELRVICPEQSK
jgi:hypothetical protein